MKHLSLYRKWRPRNMAQIVGQEPVVRTLGRAIDTGRVSHAYLFSGPRGTGKTSTAKVLAMGLNCRESDDPTSEPCGECESCRAIAGNSSLDVLEMDAASNRGIDEIRELRDKVNLAPSSGRFKVYIIDEVHMLTTEAFNALLKMLEEPPEHVVFVLATTEKHRVPATIISRCQSFDFRRPGVQVLADKLDEISTSEGIDVEPEALTTIARAGGGSFRDAEGLLDQLASFSEGRITATMVRDLLGSAGTEVLAEATEALHERRAADALRLVDRLSNEGRDLGQFTGELLEHLRRVMLFPHAPEVALAEVGESGEERERLEAQAQAIPTAEATRFVDVLGDSLGRTKRGGDPKLELELTFLRLTRDYAEPEVGALVARIEALEKALADGGNRAETPHVPRSGTRSVGPPDAADEPPTTPTSQTPEPQQPDPESGGSPQAVGTGYGETGGAPAQPAPPYPMGDSEPGAAPEARNGSGTQTLTEPTSGPESLDHLYQPPEVEEPRVEGSPEPVEPGSASPAGGDRTQSGGEAARISSMWSAVIEELKHDRQALTAAVYEEARVSGFDGSVLKLAFPEEQGFYVGMANDRKHADGLGKVLERRLGFRPGLEISVNDGGEQNPQPGPEPVREVGEVREADPEGPRTEGTRARESRREPDDPDFSGEATGPQARRLESGGATGDGRADDIIRDPREVVEMARKRFQGPGGASRDTRGGTQGRSGGS